MLGVGQLLTSTLIMRYNHKMIKKGLWFMFGLCWGGSIQICLGQSSSLIGMGVFLLAWGMGGGFYMNLSQTLIQNNTPPQVMGRVMAFHSLLMSGLAPMAALLVGVIARKIDNAPLTFSCSGALMLILAVYFTATKNIFGLLPKVMLMIRVFSWQQSFSVQSSLSIQHQFWLQNSPRQNFSTK